MPVAGEDSSSRRGGLAVFFGRRALDDARRIILIGLYAAAPVIGTAMLASEAPEVVLPLVPAPFAAITLAFALGARRALVGLALIVTVAWAASGQAYPEVLAFGFLGGAVAVLSTARMRRRSDVLFLMLFVALAHAIAATIVQGFGGDGARALWQAAAFGMLNAVVSTSAAVALLPLAESLGGFATTFTLLEWADLSQPLLRRLREEAPGTYAHTLVVAHLVESACDAIGADGLLGRVGTYYHDVGKIRQPHFFVENFAERSNPHDDIDPARSAAIIREHVRAGLEIARQHHVPRAILSFIAEHHGTLPIVYFREKARANHVMATGESFLYDGPPPQSPETAICMLADAVEAAVRLLPEPTAPRIRSVVERIVAARQEYEQFSRARITPEQLAIVQEEFVTLLGAMYHPRIDYPPSAGGVSAERASA
jgi:cyclic-di-AMP phosphodiesterase PgpH